MKTYLAGKGGAKISLNRSFGTTQFTISVVVSRGVEFGEFYDPI